MHQNHQSPCHGNEGRIRAYAFGDQQDRHILRQHMADCQRCKAYYCQQQKLAKLLIEAVPTYQEPSRLLWNLFERLRQI